MSRSILVPFSIATSALEARPGLGLDPAHFRRFIQTWEQVGVLIVEDAETGPRTLWNLVKDLPQEARTTLGSALRAAADRRLRMASDRDVPNFVRTCPIEPPVGCSRRSRVMAADPEAVVRYRLQLPAGFEAVTVDLLDQSEAFRAAFALAEESVGRGADCNEAWRERVAPLIGFARQRVTLVDHYAVSQAWRKRDKNGSYALTGLARFLREAGKMPQSVAIEVIASEDKDRPGTIASDLRDCVDEVLGRRRQRVVQLVAPDAYRFRGAVHYRCILVDSATALMLDYGIEAFTGMRVSKTLQLKLAHPKSVVRSDVDELRRAATPLLI